MIGEHKPSMPLQWLVGWPQFDADWSVVARVSGVLLSCLQPATLHQVFMYKDVVQPATLHCYWIACCPAAVADLAVAADLAAAAGAVADLAAAAGAAAAAAAVAVAVAVAVADLAGAGFAAAV